MITAYGSSALLGVDSLYQLPVQYSVAVRSSFIYDVFTPKLIIHRIVTMVFFNTLLLYSFSLPCFWVPQRRLWLDGTIWFISRHP